MKIKHTAIHKLNKLGEAPVHAYYIVREVNHTSEIVGVAYDMDSVLSILCLDTTLDFVEVPIGQTFAFKGFLD